ncbi:MAG: 50S ribosomal protein L24 [Proteobacteria bacterium]|nr:50S ribosomal protein L24 [Pseudomonadota bacterium]
MLVKRLKKGDMIMVVAGKEKGKTGKILNIIEKKNRVVAEKLNFIKRHQRPDAQGKGGIVEREGSMHISNVMLMCNKCDTGVRVGYRVLDDGKKVRVCKKCNEILDD